MGHLFPSTWGFNALHPSTRVTVLVKFEILKIQLEIMNLSLN